MLGKPKCAYGQELSHDGAIGEMYVVVRTPYRLKAGLCKIFSEWGAQMPTSYGGCG